MTLYLKLLAAVCLSTTLRVQAQPLLDPSTLRPQLLRPALLYWDYGHPDYATLETIYPTTDSTGRYWHVVHRNLHPHETEGYDYYKINAGTLQPLLSHMHHPGFIDYRIVFAGDSARLHIRRTQDSIQYSLAVGAYVAPEGPGLPVLLGSLPLALGYAVRYPELNRWAGTAPKQGQVELTTLRVTGCEVLRIADTQHDTYVVELSSPSGRYTKLWVLRSAPHYWVKVHHKVSESRVMKSHVSRLLIWNE